MFYYNPIKEVIDNYTIIGTYLNAWELLAANYYNKRQYPIIKKAVCNLLTIPKHYIRHSPAYEMVNNNLQLNPIKRSQITYLWRSRIMPLLKEICTNDFNEFERKTERNKFSNIDHEGRNDLATHISKSFTDFRSKYQPQNRINQKLEDEDTLTSESRRLFGSFIEYRLSNSFGIHITHDVIDWDDKMYLHENLINFHREYLSGRHRTGKEGTSVDPNDSYDLMHMMYVKNGYYFYTDEKLWLRNISEYPTLKAKTECGK